MTAPTAPLARPLSAGSAGTTGSAGSTGSTGSAGRAAFPVPASPADRVRDPRSPAVPGARRRPLLIGLFAVYLALLVWAVLWKLDVPHVGMSGVHRLKLVPFAATADAGASAPLEVLANVLIFVPFGVYTGLLARRRAGWRAGWAAGWRITALGAATSLGLELAQLALGTGVADTTDVITNTLGTAAGVLLLAGLRRGLGSRTARLVARFGLAGTAVVALGAVVFFVSPLQLGQRDVRVDPAPGAPGPSFER
ncbi:MAG: VanZ family protein [Leucobacter sp.]